MSWFVYIAKAKTGRYYIGYTPDLRNRISKHYAGKVQSTKSNQNYTLVSFVGFKNRNDALDFEKYLKTGSVVAFCRNYASVSDIELFVESNNYISCRLF